MQKSKNAFTMIEMVFVIVILGILAAVAIPRLAATRTDAEITKGRADVASIRSAIINERQVRLIQGDPTFISGTAMNTGGLFGGVLMYPIAAADWASTGTTAATNTYTYTIDGTATTFTYTRTDGTFTCVANQGNCNDLVD